MNIDLTALGPLAGDLLRANAPLIGQLLTTGATLAATAAGGPLAGSAAGWAVNAATGLVLSKLGVALGTSDDPAAIGKAIEADPTKAAPILQQVEADHTDLIKATLEAANRERELQNEDTADARDTMVKLASGSGISPALAKGAAYFTGYVALACVILILIPFVFRITDTQALQMLLGWQETFKYLLVLAAGYWLGSSTGSHLKSEQLANLARSPTVNAQPGAHVSAGTIRK